MKGQLEKIREEYLTVKDFSCLQALIEVSRSITVGGYLRISVKVNCKSQGFKVLHSEIV